MASSWTFDPGGCPGLDALPGTLQVVSGGSNARPIAILAVLLALWP